jgi:hypothetical protein
MQWIEAEDDLDSKLNMIEDALNKAENWKSEYHGLYTEACDMVDTLSELFDTTVDDIDIRDTEGDEEEEEEEGLVICMDDGS